MLTIPTLQKNPPKNFRKTEAIYSMIKVKLIKENIQHKIQWLKPEFDSEINEFKRVAKDKLIDLNDLRKAYKSASLIFLDNNLWKSIENTDSWETTTKERAATVAKKHNRDIDKIYQNIRDQMDSPIVLIKGDEPPTLISGNTRLMACRVLKIYPKIVLIRI